VENRWLELHRSLSRWADDQRMGRAWYLYPGEHVDQAVALVVALLGPARVESRGMAAALEKLRGRVKLGRKNLDALYAAASNDPRVQERLSRLENLTTLRKIWNDSAELIGTLKLKPVEKTLFMLLMSEDV